MNKGPSESSLQSTFFAVLALNEKKFPALKWVHASMSGASASSPAAAALRKRQGQKRGIWDVFIPFPRNNANGAWIEFKTGRNKLTSEQQEFHNMMFRFYEFYECRSVDEGLAAVEKYLGIELMK